MIRQKHHTLGRRIGLVALFFIALAVQTACTPSTPLTAEQAVGDPGTGTAETLAATTSSASTTTGVPMAQNELPLRSALPGEVECTNVEVAIVAAYLEADLGMSLEEELAISDPPYAEPLADCEWLSGHESPYSFVTVVAHFSEEYLNPNMLLETVTRYESMHDKFIETAHGVAVGSWDQEDYVRVYDIGGRCTVAVRALPASHHLKSESDYVDWLVTSPIAYAGQAVD